MVDDARGVVVVGVQVTVVIEVGVGHTLSLPGLAAGQLVVIVVAVLVVAV